MATISTEVRQNRLAELYEYGKSKGTLTYKEIMERLIEMEMDPDQLDKVLETLDAYGVTVTNDAEAADAVPADTASLEPSREELSDEALDLSVPEGVSIDEEVLSFLASRIKSNFRELEGALISLIANATLCHREITIDLAESVTGKIVGEAESDVTIDLIVRTVCEYFNITRDTLLSKSRKRQIVQARQIAMYECRNLIPNCSLSTIGAELGGKDHATVLHACTTVQDLMSTDKAFRQYVTDIENMIVVPVER